MKKEDLECDFNLGYAAWFRWARTTNKQIKNINKKRIPNLTESPKVALPQISSTIVIFKQMQQEMCFLEKNDELWQRHSPLWDTDYKSEWFSSKVKPILDHKLNYETDL